MRKEELWLCSGKLKKREAVNYIFEFFNQALTFHGIQESVSQRWKTIPELWLFYNATHKGPGTSLWPKIQENLCRASLMAEGNQASVLSAKIPGEPVSTMLMPGLEPLPALWKEEVHRGILAVCWLKGNPFFPRSWEWEGDSSERFSKPLSFGLVFVFF